MELLTDEQRRFLLARPVAHLATADGNGVPHVVPVCFAVLGERCYVAIDEKPKRVAALHLKRVRNVLANPAVSLVADRYADDWSHLGYVLLRGHAHLLERGEEHRAAVGLLRERYPQYRKMALEGAMVIAITIERVSSWGDLGPEEENA